MAPVAKSDNSGMSSFMTVYKEPKTFLENTIDSISDFISWIEKFIKPK
jgi:hypothetical protein